MTGKHERSWAKVWLTSLSGCVASVVLLGCVSRPSLEPYYGEPFFVDPGRLDEYEALACLGPATPVGCEPQAPKIRAWIREADRVLRANNTLREPE